MGIDWTVVRGGLATVQDKAAVGRKSADWCIALSGRGWLGL